MAIGTQSDWKIYDEFFRTGQMEAAVSANNLFGPALSGALQLRTEAMRGNYRYRSHLKEISGVIVHRNPVTVTSATRLAPTEDEHIAVKIHRTYGPVSFTSSQLRKVGTTPQAMSLALGRDYETRKLKDMVFTTILALESAITDVSALNYDATGDSPATMTPSGLLRAFQKFGDASEQIVAVLAHSTPWFDFSRHLVATDKVDTVYTGLIRAMDVPSFGRRFGVIDSPALFDGSGSGLTHNILGLVEGAGLCIETNQEEIAFDRITGLVNLIWDFQAEYEFAIELKGYKWDVGNGGANPTDGTLGTTGNWDKVASQDKNTAGVRLKTK
jgi:hypothetical protein